MCAPPPVEFNSSDSFQLATRVCLDINNSLGQDMDSSLSPSCLPISTMPLALPCHGQGGAYISQWEL